MKPWKETWYRRHNSACRWEIRKEVSAGEDVRTRVAELDDYDFENDEEKAFISAQGARANLVAAAPEMARLLLELQNVPCMGDWCGGCAVCRGGDDGAAHRPDCELVAVLRKAGVID